MGTAVFILLAVVAVVATVSVIALLASNLPLPGQARVALVTRVRRNPAGSTTLEMIGPDLEPSVVVVDDRVAASVHVGDAWPVTR